LPDAGVRALTEGRHVPGLVLVPVPALEFEEVVVTLLDRFQRQQDRPLADPTVLRAVAARLGELVRSAPPPGDPGTVAAQIAGPGLDPGLADAVTQLVKAVTYPRLDVCRESYQEPGPDGSCRRQQAAQARRRISGTHCVDCPHWLAFGPVEHAAWLRAAWRSDPAEFDAAREIFLPEDFRALRRLLFRAQ
jgi:hypothetical protein